MTGKDAKESSSRYFYEAVLHWPQIALWFAALWERSSPIAFQPLLTTNMSCVGLYYLSG